jgi:hypothetical protein
MESSLRYGNCSILRGKAPLVLLMRKCIFLVIVVAFFEKASIAFAQTDSAAITPLEANVSSLRLGPFDLHPRLTVGVTYDDDILFATTDKEADLDWMIQPALQAVAGDDAGLIAYRDQKNNVLDLTPGNLIIRDPDDRPGKLFIMDYGPRFQLLDKYTANNSVDEFATVDLLWATDKLILGVKQDYQLQKITIIEAGERTTVETIPTQLSAAYQFTDKVSMESDFGRTSIDYSSPGLTGYTEYNTQDWLNYEVAEKLNASLGVLAGWDLVTGHQDQTYEQLRARARYNYTEKLTFDVSVGGELRQYENGSSETLTPVFSLAGVYQVAERTWLQLTGSREIYAAIFNGYNYTTTGVTLDVRQEITDRFTAKLSIGYSSIEYAAVNDPSTTHNDDFVTARLSFEAKIRRYVNGEIYYQWINRQSQFQGALDDNQVGAQVTLGF